MKLQEVKLVNQGAQLALYQAEYKLPNGQDKTYEFVSRAGARQDGPGSATIMDETTFPDRYVRGVIMMVLDKTHGNVLLMNEFRPATGHMIFNHPMGLIDPGEDVKQACARELKEETGLDIIRIIDILPPAYTAPGMSDQQTVTVILEADGEIKPSENPNEVTEPFWAGKRSVQAFLASDHCKFSALTQAMLFAWAYL